MSLWGTVYYDDELEVTEHAWDHHIRITVTGVPYRLQTSRDTLELQMPLWVWEKLRCHTSPMAKDLTISDGDLEAEARKWVGDRVEEYRQLDEADPRREVVALSGCLVADIDLPYEEQVRSYIRHYREIRDNRGELYDD